MVAQLAALGLFVAVFAVAARRNLHLGISMLPVACAVGIWLAGMPLDDVLGGFPVGIVVLLAGVTYFFGIAHVNGTIEALMAAVIARIGHRAVTLPGLFFLLTAIVSAMGSPLAGLITAPIGMPLAKRFHIDPMLMALAIATGLSAGGFAPTSLFGIVTYGVAQGAGVDLQPFVLFAVAFAANAVLFGVAFLAFGGPALARVRREASASPVAVTVFTSLQKLTLVCIAGLIAIVVLGPAFGLDPDIGVLSFAFGAFLMLVDPAAGRAAIARVDWSTVLLVAGIITFVGVLQSMGAVELLGDAAEVLTVPVLTALAICLVGALVSAFASTTGILAALVPLAALDGRRACGLGADQRARRMRVARRSLAVLDGRRDVDGDGERRGQAARDVAVVALGNVARRAWPGGARRAAGLAGQRLEGERRARR